MAPTRVEELTRTCRELGLFGCSHMTTSRHHSPGLEVAVCGHVTLPCKVWLGVSYCSRSLLGHPMGVLFVIGHV